MTSLLVPDMQGHDEGAAYDRLAATLQGLPTDDAIRKVKEFLVTFPSFALAHNDLGVLYHRSGNPTLALAHYEKASRLQPDNTLLRKNLADFYAVELGWVEDAIDIYLEVVKRNPRDTEALIALGRLGAALAGSRTLEKPQPQPQLETAVTPTAPVVPPTAPLPPVTPPKTDQELYQDAQTLAAQGAFYEAAARLQELIARQPSNALYHNDLGVVSSSVEDMVTAQRHYEQAVALEPANPVFVRNLADFYFVKQQRVDDAIHLYLGLYRKAPRDVETLINLGHICAAVARGEEARAFYKRALDIEPWNTEAREGLKSQTQSAPAPIVQKQPSADELVAEARLLVDRGQLMEARNLLQRARDIDPRSAVACNDLGVVAYKLGDISAAQAAYEQAANLDPANQNFRKNLADLYFVAAGRQDDAIRIYLELFKNNPRDVEILSALGTICQKVGRPDEAKSFYRRALEVEPWNREVREALQA